MSSFINEFHFLRPYWLLLLLPAVVIAGVQLRQALNRGQWHRHIDESLRSYMLDQAPDQRATLNSSFLLLCWIIAAVALAGPAWERKAVPVVSNPDALVILMDMSLSMGSQDIAPTRAVRAVRKATDILRGREDGVTAVIAYAGDAHTVVPFTDDHATIEHLLTSLSPEIMPKPGSRPDKALLLAGKLMTDATVSKASILLITDGIIQKDIERIRTTLPVGSELSVIAVGTAEGAPVPLGDQGFLKDGAGNIVLPRLDTTPLQTLYNATGSRWRTISFDDSDWKSLLTSPAMDDMNADEERTITEWTDAGYWLIFLILPLALLSFRKGLLFSLTLILMMPSQNADAFTWDELWKTGDQRGKELLDSDPAAAADAFDNPLWKATAHYRAGNFGEAARLYNTIDSPESDYNRGNALALAGEYDKAIEAYRKALQQRPEFPEAIYNLDLLEKMKKDQEQNPDQQQNQNSDQQQNQNSDQQQNQNSDQQQNQNSDQQQNQNSDQQQNQSSDQQQKQNSDSQRSDANKQDDDNYAEEQAQQKADENAEQQKNTAQQKQQEKQKQQPSTAQREGDDRQSEQRSARQTEEQAGDQPDEEFTGLTEDDSAMTREQRAAMDSVLNQVPDNPGLLMERKFLYQYRQSGDTNEEDVLW